MRGKCSRGENDESVIRSRSKRKGDVPLTFSTGIRLDELFLGTGFFEFGGQPGQLRQDLIDQTNFRGKVVLVEVQGKVAADESWMSQSLSPGHVYR